MQNAFFGVRLNILGKAESPACPAAFPPVRSGGRRYPHPHMSLASLE
jgi:hypothetical protein